MRITRYAMAALCGILLLGAGFTGNSSFVSAQVGTQAATTVATLAATQAVTQAATPEAQACVLVAPADLDTGKGACAKDAMNSACLIGNKAQVKMADSTGPTFEKPGDQIDITKLASLQTATSDPQVGSSGVVQFKLQGGLPATGVGVNAVL